MRLSFVLLCIVGCLLTQGQIRDDKQIMAAIGLYGVLVVNVQPLKHIQLKMSDMKAYMESYNEHGRNLDTNMLAEIIANCEALDPAPWTDSELPMAVLVQNRGDRIDRQEAIRNWHFVDPIPERTYKKLVRQYNAKDSSDRNIFYLSRPVYNQAGNMAVVAWDNGHSILFSGAGIDLYQLGGSKWVRMGPLQRWAY